MSVLEKRSGKNMNVDFCQWLILVLNQRFDFVKKLVSPLLFLPVQQTPCIAVLQSGRLCDCENSTTGIVEKCCYFVLIFHSCRS